MNDAYRYFLGVQRSFSGVSWTNRLTQRQEAIALAIAQTTSIPDMVARVLAARGVLPHQAQEFLEPTIRRDLPDPSLLTDMLCVAQRIVRAIVDSEKITIFGDYDVDGAASCALLYSFLEHCGVRAEMYIPDRVLEGYGPNISAMEKLAKSSSLIITVDCGSNSADSIEVARANGCDVVVIDHHQVSDVLPLGVGVVNPNRQDDLSGQGHLCAAGVVFLVLVQVAKILREDFSRIQPPDLLQYLDLVALATLCDVVPLEGVNRAFVAKGLLVLRNMSNVGLAALFNLIGLREPLNPFHVSFLLGPRINAGGRIGHPMLGARLLTTNDPALAHEIAQELDALNKSRQAMERDMLKEAMQEIESMSLLGRESAIITLGSDRWHPGLVGLIAARLKEHTRRPSFAIHFYPHSIGVGSGRSISGFDIGALVRSAVEEGLLLKGGGHKMAAGISVDKKNLSALRDFFNAKAQDAIAHLRQLETMKIDGVLTASSLTPFLLDMLESAGPYGAGYPAPVFVLSHHHVLRTYIINEQHIKVDLLSSCGVGVRAIAFRCVGSPLGKGLLASSGKKIHLAGTLAFDYWKGTRSIQFRILDAAEISSTIQAY